MHACMQKNRKKAVKKLKVLHTDFLNLKIEIWLLIDIFAHFFSFLYLKILHYLINDQLLDTIDT